MIPLIGTYTGKRVNPLDLKPEDIDIRDIAHHLACINRFVGGLQRPVSVAQHSCFVYHLTIGTGWEKEALFHDATEAYLGDVSKWVKADPSMKTYREYEDKAWRVICTALNLRYVEPTGLHQIVHAADKIMVRYEAHREGGAFHPMFDRAEYPRPSREETTKIGYWYAMNWQDAEYAFLAAVEDLGYKV